MKKHTALLSLVFLMAVFHKTVTAQTQNQKQELSFNFFRSPSMGLEWRNKNFSAHSGIYPTILTPIGAKSKTSWFVRVGLSYWYKPEQSLAAYTSISMLWTLDHRGRSGQQGAILESGGRWSFFRTQNDAWHLRLGASALYLEKEGLFVRPNPSLGYSRFF